MDNAYKDFIKPTVHKLSNRRVQHFDELLHIFNNRTFPKNPDFWIVAKKDLLKKFAAKLSGAYLSGKNSVGLMGVGLMGVGLMGCRTNGLSD